MKQSIKIGLLILGLIACVSACIKLESTDANAETNAPKSKPERFNAEGVGRAGLNGIYVITDPKTQCQYIVMYENGITPRVYSDGIQVCGESTYPNGEHSVTTDADGFPSNEFSKNIPE